MHAMGIDIGTTTISMVLVDAGSGDLIARETVNHGAFIDDGCPVGKVQDAGRILSIVMEKYAALNAAHGLPGCIGLTGQMHSVLYVDAARHAVSPLYTWQDGRGNLPFEGGMSCAEYLRAHGAGAAASGYGLTTHFCLMKSGQVPRDAAKLTTISDYVAMRLTGSSEPVLCADMAASWGCFDLKNRAFKRDALCALGVDASMLPRVTSGPEVIGRTPEGVPVINSLGDNQASVLGSVQDLENTVLINVGTGSQVSVGTRRFIECDGAIELRPCTDSSFICVGSGLCGGRAYAMLEQFYREVAGADAPVYDRMLAGAEAFCAEYGEDAAWRVRTTFSGTRSDPSARGGIEGIGIDNFRPGALTVGVVAGILDELHGFYGRMCELTGSKAKRLVGSGNGLRKNPLMRKLAEAKFGLELEIPECMEEAACGAALYALYASGKVPSLERAQALIRYQARQ